MKLLYVFLFFVIGTTGINAQSIPSQTCGILYTYDNAGNRIKQEYFCNNNGRVISAQTDTLVIDTSTLNFKNRNITSFQIVDALYPNPTTGVFYITFSNPLQNVQIILTDLNGRILNRFKGNGNKVRFDLSNQPNGVYYIRIGDGNAGISKKVIKAN